MLIKIFILIFILFVLSRIYARYRKKDINGREFGLWLVFWCVIGVAAIMPQKTDILAKFVGVERGSDLLIYISVLVLFYAVFRILVKLERVDREITDVVRHIAVKDKKEE